jgi:hypothetical protein
MGSSPVQIQSGNSRATRSWRPRAPDHLKALAELHDLSLGDLLEGICLHAFDGKLPFDAEGRRRIAELRKIYGLDLDASDSHRLVERSPAASTGRARPPRGR